MNHFINKIDPVLCPPEKNYWCKEWPDYWPQWVGGDIDFRENRRQPFEELIQLRLATMLEF